MHDRRPLLLVVLLLAGCADLQSVNPFQPRDTALEVAGTLVSPDNTPAQRKRLVDEVNRRYKEDPSSENLLALAVAYAVPGQQQSSTGKALALLDKLDTSKLSRLANWLGSDVAYRDSLENSNKQLGEQLADLKEALARAREKIEILTHIEQTIGPAPQLEQNPGDKKH